MTPREAIRRMMTISDRTIDGLREANEEIASLRKRLVEETARSKRAEANRDAALKALRPFGQPIPNEIPNDAMAYLAWIDYRDGVLERRSLHGVAWRATDFRDAFALISAALIVEKEERTESRQTTEAGDHG